MREFLRLTILAILACAFAGTLATIGLFAWYGRNLPDTSALLKYEPRQVNRIFSADGLIIGESGPRRTFVSIEEMPPILPNAFVAAEDEDFYQHEGVSLPHIVMAMYRNLLAMRVKGGGSTITQQLVKNVLLSDERKLSRKIKEALLAYEIENRLSKREILEIYMNTVYFGNQCYGVAEAAHFYFDRELSRLTVGQIAYLAGLVQSPGLYRLNRHPESARVRQQYVLGRLRKLEYINQADFERISAEPLKYVKAENRGPDAPYVKDLALREVRERLGEELIKRGGLKIYTSIDSRMQSYAEEALRAGLIEYDRRHTYKSSGIVLDKAERKAFRELFEGYPDDAPCAFTAERRALKIEDDEIPADYATLPENERPAAWRNFAWRTRIERMEEGRVYLAVVDKIAADGNLAVILGKHTGVIPATDVKAAVKRAGKEARADSLFAAGTLVQVMPADKLAPQKDQASKLKLVSLPEVQGAFVAMDPDSHSVRALVGGFAFNQGEYNRAVRAKRQPGSSFKPFVYLSAIKSRKFTAATIVEDAPITIKIAGAPDWSPQNYDPGFRGPLRLREALAFSLNTVAARLIEAVTPQEVVKTAQALGIKSKLRAEYSLALGASEVTPLELASAYTALADRGRTAEPLFITKVVGSDGMTLLEFQNEKKQAVPEDEVYVLVSMLQSVMDHGTGASGKIEGRPLAGKTGTANEQRDAWFAGFSPQLAAVVWVGFDDHRPLGHGETGARAALPIWSDFMRKALKDKPIVDFATPPGVSFITIDPLTGLRVDSETPNGLLEVFLDGTEPGETPEDGQAGDGTEMKEENE